MSELCIGFNIRASQRDMRTSKNITTLKVIDPTVLPTVEDVLCGGQRVSLAHFKEAVGDRLILCNRKLCTSHVRGLAASISKYGEVFLPIIIERTEDNRYIVVDGYHRLAALEMIHETTPEKSISATVKLRRRDNVQPLAQENYV